MIQASRGMPPQVAPVTHKGIRYEQVMNGLRQGLPHRTGYLSATDIASGKQLWTLLVYETGRDPAMETDVQDVYFAAMTLQEQSDTLRITTESKQCWNVRLADRTVTPRDK